LYLPLSKNILAILIRVVHIIFYHIRFIVSIACADLSALGLRELWGVLDEASLGLAGQALQLIDWDRCHCFCGRCGEPMELSPSDRSKRCPA
jgi:NADH pyrophosphatase NudC (nudix superfamily)